MEKLIPIKEKLAREPINAEIELLKNQLSENQANLKQKDAEIADLIKEGNLTAGLLNKEQTQKTKALAAANNNLYITLKDGTVACYSE